MPDDDLLGTGSEPQSEPTGQEPVSPESQVDVELAVAEPTGTEPATEPDKQKLVPLAALHEERERRKELSAKLEETTLKSARDMATLQERVNTILQAVQQQMEPPKEVEGPLFVKQFMAANPGVSLRDAEEAYYAEEPNNYLRYKQNQLEQHQSTLAQVAQQQAQSDRVQEQFANFVNAYQGQAAEFKSQMPDFQTAYNFLMSNRDAELQTLGFVDPTQRRQIMQNEEIGIVEHAFRDRVNPAKRLYDIAKFRGYKIDVVSNGGVASNTSSTTANLDKEKKAAAATQSLGAVAGSPSTSKVTAESLIAMSDDEFAAATSGSKWKEMFK